MSESLLKCLNEFTLADWPKRLHLLKDLSGMEVLVPFSKSLLAGAERKVRIVSETVNGRNEICVFSSRELLTSWALGAEYQALELVVGDLALAIPEGSCLRFDPGTDRELLVPSREVKGLAYPELLENLPEEPAGATIAKEYTEEKTGFGQVIKDKISEESESEQNTLDNSLQVKLSENNENPSSEDLQFKAETELAELFVQYPSIEEAYLLNPSPQTSLPETRQAPLSLALGIIMEDIFSEDRFHLVEGIAEISRKYLGEAGAIEVYDDLAQRGSASWDLFQAERPFYFREKLSSRSNAADLLSGELELERPELEAEIEKPNRLAELWSAFKGRTLGAFKTPEV